MTQQNQTLTHPHEGRGMYPAMIYKGKLIEASEHPRDYLTYGSAFAGVHVEKRA